MRTLRKTNLILLIFGGLPSVAHGGSYSVEFGGGLSKMNSPSAIYRTSTAPAGAAALLGASFLLTPGADIPVWLGFENRVSTTGSKMLDANYLSIRFGFWRLYFTLGGSPLLFTSGVTKGGSSFSRTSGYSGLGEVGYLFPITPEISFNIAGAAQEVSIGGGHAGPSMEGTASFALYFGSTSSSSGKSGHPGYKGYRYPYGFERGD